MPEESQKCNSTANRLEDFIVIAKNGERVKLEVNLRKQVISPKDPSEKPYHLKVGEDMYLLMGDFLFGDESNNTIVSKVYAMGCVAGPEIEAQADNDVANERLKMDYHRLKSVGIDFTEKYF